MLDEGGDESDWRDENPGDPQELASELRSAAQEIRHLDVKALSADLFNDIPIPESYASSLDDLADKAVPH